MVCDWFDFNDLSSGSKYAAVTKVIMAPVNLSCILLLLMLYAGAAEYL